MTDSFDIDASLFMRVRRAVSRESVRYSLNGVLIQPIDAGGAWMVATDGHLMIVARDRSAVVPRPAVIDLTLTEAPPPDPRDCDECDCALMPVDYFNSRLAFDVAPGGRTVAAFKRGDTEWHHGIVNDLDCADKFPDWRTVWVTGGVPKEPRKGHVAYGLDPRLLARVCDNESAILTSTGEGTAVAVAVAGQPDIAALIMPTDCTDAGGAELIAELLAMETKA